jgi:uncharacterized protein (DUF2235 family)
MPKNIVICLDGTNNEFGVSNTNVVRLFQSLDLSDPSRQVGYYDPGVGTIAEPGMVSKLGKWWSQAMGLAFGRGITQNIEEAYAYLMEHHRAGDRIYIFGFSRGAYTARALAGMLHLLGLLPSGHVHLVPYASKLFRSLQSGAEKDGNGFWKTTNAFRATFAGGRERCPVAFLGLWDTVASVGWVWNPKSFPYVTRNPGVKVVRHALAIDERRCFFRQSPWLRHQQAESQDILEWWFPGVHSDVGGGYDESESALWRKPFVWMLSEANRQGLLCDRRQITKLCKRIKSTHQSAWRDPMHNSLKGPWHLAEVFPKLAYLPRIKRTLPTLGLWGWRRVPSGAAIHQSVLLRLRDPGCQYQPGSLSGDFRARVQAQNIMPRVMPYQE